MPTTRKARSSSGRGRVSAPADVRPRGTRRSGDGALSSFLRGARLTVVLGVGSELRGDDAAGILVARRLAIESVKTVNGRKEPVSELVAIEGHTAPESFAGKIVKLRPSHLLFVDAAHIGARPGGWRLLREDEVDASVTATHLIPISTLAAHIRGETGCAVGFVGIQPGDCGVAVGASDAVLAAVEDVAGCIVRALNCAHP